MRKQYTVPCAVKEKTSSECTSATWKKSGKGFKVCKKEMLWLCAAVKNNDVDGLLTRVEKAQMVDVQIHEEIIVQNWKLTMTDVKVLDLKALF